MSPIDAKEVNTQIPVVEKILAQGDFRHPLAPLIPQIKNIVDQALLSDPEINIDNLEQLLIANEQISKEMKDFNPSRYSHNPQMALSSFIGRISDLNTHALYNIGFYVDGDDKDKIILLQKMNRSAARPDTPPELALILNTASTIFPILILDIEYENAIIQEKSEGKDVPPSSITEVQKWFFDYRQIKDDPDFLKKLTDLVEK